MTRMFYNSLPDFRASKNARRMLFIFAARQQRTKNYRRRLLARKRNLLIYTVNRNKLRNAATASNGMAITDSFGIRYESIAHCLSVTTLQFLWRKNIFNARDGGNIAHYLSWPRWIYDFLLYGQYSLTDIWENFARVLPTTNGRYDWVTNNATFCSTFWKPSQQLTSTYQFLHRREITSMGTTSNADM